MIVNGGGGEGIAGDPVALEDAAAAFVRAGSAFEAASEDIGRHGRAVTAQWSGAASQMAGASISDLAMRTLVGADVCAAAGPILTAYARVLRAAQPGSTASIP